MNDRSTAEIVTDLRDSSERFVKTAPHSTLLREVADRLEYLGAEVHRLAMEHVRADLVEMSWLRRYFIDTYNTDWSSSYQIELIGKVPPSVLAWADVDQLGDSTEPDLRVVR